MNAGASAPTSLAELARLFLSIGDTSFGGPVARGAITDWVAVLVAAVSAWLLLVRQVNSAWLVLGGVAVAIVRAFVAP